MYERILYSTDSGVATVTLNRPEKRNSLDATTVRELHEAVEAANSDALVRCIVIAAHGDAFCAGADLAALQAMATADIMENRRDSAALMETFRAIASSPKPTVARVHGPALAGGCGLATVCDITVASSNATFGYPEVRIGFIPAIVMVFLRLRVGEAVAKDLVLRGRTLDAAEAQRIGLIAHCVAPAELDSTIATIVGDLKKASQSALALAKQMFTALPGMAPDAALEYAASMNALARQTDDCRAGVAAFLSRSNTIQR
jgi:methylglutaconyl-CoA hydratase